MRKITLILGLAVLVLTVLAGWQIGACELANMNFQEDLHDLASQVGTHIGFAAPTSDEEMNLIVVHKAKEHGIDLQATQVTVRRTNSGETSTLYLAADYTVPVNLAFFSVNLHFTPTSDKKGM
jgi:hypothetical protein